MSLAPAEEEQNPSPHDFEADEPVDEAAVDETAVGDAGPPPVTVRSARRRRHSTRGGWRERALQKSRHLDNLSITALVNIVVIAILAGALAFTLVHFNDQTNQTSLRKSALDAAAIYGAEMSTYNYKNLNGPGSPWSKVEANATPAFRSDFAKTSGDLTKLLNQYNATAVGHVIDAGVETLTSSKAVVLVFIDQAVTNTVQKPNSVTQPLRVLITLVRHNGKWLIDNLQVPA
jgi:Mce-associated membrane protein